MRVIAEQEGVSRGVVTSAISILVGRGMLERLPRHGIKVCAKPTEKEENQLVGALAQQCVDLINNRRVGNNKICRSDDIRTIRKCFAQIMNEEFASALSGTSEIVTREDAVLYEKGIRCAGWSPDKYTLYKCDLTGDSADLLKGNFLNFTFDKTSVTFDDKTMEYVEKRVHPNDANDYLGLMNRKCLIAKAELQDVYTSLEYREKIKDKYRWVKLSINSTKESGNGDVTLYLLYQDIDAEKRNEILLKERTCEDALTGALNRRAFILQVEQLLSESDEGRQHAFLMLDIDGFKSINDIFGHPVGDMVLVDLSKALRSILRYGDLLGRMGGDEFVICLKDIPFDAVIERKAAQINELMCRNFDNGVSISGSIGVVVYPRDGNDYETLYNKMDIALYHVKENGKNHFEYYNENLKRSDGGIAVIDAAVDEKEQLAETLNVSKKKILVVDDNDTNRSIISEMIKDDYTVLQAKDGRRALLTLRRYGASISVVLLDLIMPGMSGFDVLANMRREPVLKSIPVIVVSGLDDYENEFKAIEMGATDFVRKPVNQRLLKLRISNSVNKQENDRLRVQNSYLQLQGDEEQRYRHIVQSTGTIVIEHDWVNSVFTYDKSISQYLAGNFDHRPLWRVLLSDMVASSVDVKAMQHMIYELANSHTEVKAAIKIKLKTADGEKHWFSIKAFKITDEFSIASKMIITLNDINADIMVEEQLRNLVEYDSLLGIYNRRAFLEKADDIIKGSVSGKWVLSIIDIDSFNVYNHLYGHDEGDRLLIYLANQINNAVSRYGGVCGRLQADVFAVLHPSRRDYVDALTEIWNNALKSYSMLKKVVLCTGRYYIDDLKLSINTILDRAIIAHRTAKHGFEKDLYFTEDMQRKLLREQEIVSKMEQALAENRFCVYFQPIINYNSNKMVTAEALVRWIAEDGTVIPPNEFIPIFEQNGFIVRLDAYVWEKVCEHIRCWLDTGIEVVPISVNVSRMDIYSGKLVETITRITKKYKIPPNLLRLEITESAYMKNSDMIISYVEELQKLGYIIEMDDFGSGFSSLNILSEVPVDILKLDMRFILGEDKIGRKEKIMGHIINMAKSTNIEVIAEGVELYEQAELLKSLGCLNMQGYLFSRPVIDTDFVKFFSQLQMS